MATRVMAMGRASRSAEGARRPQCDSGLLDKGLTKWVFRAGGRRAGSRSLVMSRVGSGARATVHQPGGPPARALAPRLRPRGDYRTSLELARQG